MTAREREECLALLCRTIEIVTVNPDGNEKALADFVAAYLAQQGVAVQVDEFAPLRANVTARLCGQESGGALLLNGHLDTVPFGNVQSWHTPPDKAVLQDGLLFGRGTSDMKSGLCALIYALVLLKREGFVPKHDLLFAGTADEETNGLGAQRLLEQGLLKDVECILIGEPTGGKVSVSAKGALWVEFTVQGRAAHGAYPWQGVNAAEVALLLFKEVKQGLGKHASPYFEGSTCTLTQIAGGVKANMVPDLCVMTLDVRTVSTQQAGAPSAQQMLEKAVASIQQKQEGAKITYRILNERPAVEIAQGHPLVQELCEAVQAGCGHAAELTGTGFFSDASVFVREKPWPCVLYGPGESAQAHQPNEHVAVSAYFEAIECLYHFLKKQ